MYLGNQPALSYTSFAKQDFTTSATTSYVLDYPVTNENEIALFINFVRQEPGTAYTASNTSLTLTSATSASDDMYAIFLGKAVQTVNPPAGSVGASQIADGSIALGKLSATGTKDSTTFLRGDNTFAEAGGGKVLQVVNSFTATEVVVSSGTYVDTGLTATITPSSASNKVLVLIQQSIGKANADNHAQLRIYRDATEISGVIAGRSIAYTGDSSYNYVGTGFSCSFLDTPSSTSALVYKTQVARNGGGAGAARVQHDGCASYITLLEIAG